MEQQYPAIEEVILGWEGDVGQVNEDIRRTRDIDPQSRQLVHLIYSDSNFPNVPVDPPTLIHAVISSIDALNSLNPRIIEHGFVPGRFVVRIDVMSQRANCREYFKVSIGNQWRKLTMRELRWFEKRG